MHNKIINFNVSRFLFIIFSLSLVSTVSTPAHSFAAAPCVLSFSIATDANSASDGQILTRTLTLKNTAKTSCRSVSYSVFYSPNESFVSSTPAPRASNYYWYVGTLNAGKQVTTKILTQVTSVSNGDVVTEACGSATGAKDACVDSVVSVTQTIPTSSQVVSTSTSPSPVVATSTATTTPIVVSSIKNEQGIWVWNFPSQMNTTTGNQQMQALASHGFNVVYVTIDDYLSIAGMTDGAAKNTAKAAYFESLSQFITKAHSLGITVDAEGGWRDWAYSVNRWKGFALIDAMKEYNSLYPNAKIRNFQYDVEPYLLPEYETNKAQVLTDYVTFIDQSTTRLVGSDIGFSIVIPHFYDDVNQWTPPITYNGVTNYTYNQLLTILEKKAGSTILIMAYRNFFEGTNGTRAVSETEVKEASAGFHSHVVIGQETGNVAPSYVTYYGLTKTALFNGLSQITSTFSTYSGYAGTAVDYMEPFFALQ